MKRTPVDKIAIPLPAELESLTRGARLYDSSCSPDARVYFIDKDEGYYLKAAARKSLKIEAEMIDYFYKKGLGAELLYYSSSEIDLMLTSKVRGEDCTHPMYLEEPERLCDLLAERLRMLHDTDFTGCPVANRTKDYLALAASNYEKGFFNADLFSDKVTFSSADDAFRLVREGERVLKADVLLHGDYCLPNIILDGFRFSGFIDLGCGGVGDRHLDVFWGAWTLWFNLKTDRYSYRFIDAYGRDVISDETLRIVAAAECFG